MNFVDKKLIIFVLFAIANLFPQSNLQKQYDYAYNLFNQEKYFDAITEFKRLQYFDWENQFEYQSNLLIGKSYKAGAKFDDAIKYFTIAEMNAKNDLELLESNLLNARTNILRRTTKQTEKILNELLINPRFISNENEIKYWLGWNYIFSDEWEKAYQVFSKDNLDTTLAKLCKSVDEEMYSVSFAKYSSYFVPGAGQFYTGEYISGALSLGWNLLFGYLTIKSFLEDRVFDGIMVGNFLWLRFYSGNFQNAEKFAVQKNLETSNKALLYLQYHFLGEKP
jgi:tetratricopeptide (TPR) repeat protein